MEKYLSIEEAKYVDGYKIYLKFNDGKENTLDFKNFILSSRHPGIRKYENKNLFKNFNLEYGDLEWNDYDLAFPIADLYEGNQYLSPQVGLYSFRQNVPYLITHL